jgi:Family of unknown function (DUF6115)
MTLSIVLLLNLAGWALFILIFRIILRRTVRPDRILEQIETEIGSLLTDLNGTTERNIRLLEETIRRLKSELQQADKRIRILQGESERHAAEERTPPAAEYTHLASRKPIKIEVLPDDPPVKEPDEDIRTSILKLYRQGLDSRIIAVQVGRPLGEVELIISLSEKTDR